MDSSSIGIPGLIISGISQKDDVVTIHMQDAIITKTMTGSVEQTKWRQTGDLVFSGATVQSNLPQFPAICTGGEIGETIYIYRDMIPIPLASNGQSYCDLKVEGLDEHIRINARSMKLDMHDVAKYIEHIRDN